VAASFPKWVPTIPHTIYFVSVRKSLFSAILPEQAQRRPLSEEVKQAREALA